MRPKVFNVTGIVSYHSTEGAMKKFPTRTKHVGVYYILGTDPLGKPRRTFYIQYYRDGKRHFEKAGHESRELTAAVAN